MFRLLILMALLISTAYGFNYDKYLKSEIRAQIKMQKLVDDEGDYKESIKFGKIAYQTYASNVFIISYYAKALYLEGNLNKSKILFMKILSIDPTNDIASEFIKKIEEQAQAKVNKDLESVLGHLTGQGFDFLLIFLGFLGAEVLAKKYNDCESSTYVNVIDHYIFNSDKEANIFIRITSFLQEYANSFFSLCNFLSIIVLSIISVAVTISITWVEYMGWIDLVFSNERLDVISSSELWNHFIFVFFVTFLIIVFNKIIIYLKQDIEDELDVANTLQKLALENEFELLKECIDKLNSATVVTDDKKSKIMNYCINEEAKVIISNMNKLCIKI